MSRSREYFERNSRPRDRTRVKYKSPWILTTPTSAENQQRNHDTLRSQLGYSPCAETVVIHPCQRRILLPYVRVRTQTFLATGQRDAGNFKASSIGDMGIRLWITGMALRVRTRGQAAVLHKGLRACVDSRFHGSSGHA